MKFSLRYLVLLAFALAVVVPATAAATTVNLRVEGVSLTRLNGTVSTSGNQVFKDFDPSHFCAGHTAADAMEVGTSGNWGGDWDAGFSQFEVDTILGETYNSGKNGSGNVFWAFWVNNSFAPTGTCKYVPASNDQLLYFPSCFATPCPPGVELNARPSEITGVSPGSPTANQDFTVNVRAYDFSGPLPASGATVRLSSSSGNVDRSADSSGAARFNVPAGTYNVQVIGGGYIRSTISQVTVTATQSGSGGTTGGTGGFTPATPGQIPPGSGTPGGTTTPPGTGTSTGGTSTQSTTFPRSISTNQVNVTGPVGRHKRFSVRGAPSRVSAVLDVDSRSIRQVKFRINRRVGDRCWFFSGTEERFRGAKCGRTPWFRMSLADATQVLDGGVRFEQPLGGRVPKGRYVFDVKAQGQDGRYTALVRGRTREVFFVGVPRFRVGF